MYKISLRATSDIADRYGSELATEEDFSTEYLDLLFQQRQLRT